MNNYRKLFEKFFLLLSSFSYPAFLFDANDRIIEMNVPLKRIIKKANTSTDDVNIRNVLKMNGCDINFKKEQLCKDGISVLKYKNHRIMHISLLAENDSYAGGIMIMISDVHHDPPLSIGSPSFGMKHRRNVKTGFPHSSSTSKKLKEVLNNIEKDFIERTLNETNNRSEAIKRLGVSRRTFYYKMRKYDLL
ncbi:MAG: hypothetical protein M1591_01205 [Deltaproteobacteria bacterium]|nr:hypothetical protein [Deltaproteobacteria bacterium]